jgi:serine/threonine-protein kinase RIO1
MGDLGTPVTEVGSPADIDMDAACDPYAEEEEDRDIFYIGDRDHRHDYRDRDRDNLRDNHHHISHPINWGSTNQVRERGIRRDHREESQLIESAYEEEGLNKSHIEASTSFDSGDGIAGTFYSNPRVSRDRVTREKSESNLYSIFEHPGAAFKGDKSVGDLSLSFASASSTQKSNQSLSSIISPRPQPDQTAFDRPVSTIGGGGSNCPGTPIRGISICPATPRRDSWKAGTPYAPADDEKEFRLSEREGDRQDEDHHATLTRQNSLHTNKVLLSLSDSLESADVSFTRDFEHQGFLGSGTFADVYKAKEKDGKSYAIKKSKRPFRSKKDRNLLMCEVMMMKKLGEAPCIYIVQLIRAWQEEGYFFVQIDLAERGTLKDLLTHFAQKVKMIEDDVVWHIVHDVTCGLQHIHKCGLVHLDVKPANLLISMEGVIKIGDFGMAAEQGKGEDGHEGDTRYMAPELLDSSDRYPPADIFSLGLTLYEVCISSLSQNIDNVAAGNSPLPSEGLDWHVLRDGQAPPLLGRSIALTTLIKVLLPPCFHLF